ncbi:hypothetical protein EGH73_00875 [Epilithonimonas hominis]|uniref:Uncharacterized protein n=1 Tax=Epilithonimonas hominis TaxID=420404 RepID=A0A3N0XDV8_9FLAO|nr:hypothetical protein EGH73_00875 [Epilithonimonas hominis]
MLIFYFLGLLLINSNHKNRIFFVN